MLAMASIFILRCEDMLQGALSMLSVRLLIRLSQLFTVRYHSDGEQTNQIRPGTTKLPEGRPVVVYFPQLVSTTTSARGPEDERDNKYAFFPRLLVKSLQHWERATIHGRRANFT